jgi:hypothetical protein
MAAENASLGVRCDHWKIVVARAERLEFETKKNSLQCWKQPKIDWCVVRCVRSMRNNLKFVVVGKLVNPSRPKRRSVGAMKEESCRLLVQFFT